MRSHRPLGSPPSAQQMAQPVISCSPLLCSAELQQLISRQAEVRPAKQCVIARASQHHAFRQQFHFHRGGIIEKERITRRWARHHGPHYAGQAGLPDCADIDRKSTRLNSITNAHLVCRLLLEKKNTSTNYISVLYTACLNFIFFLIFRRPPRSKLTYTLVPYTKLFRSSRQAEVRPAKQCVIARASQHHAFRQQFHFHRGGIIEKERITRRWARHHGPHYAGQAGLPDCADIVILFNEQRRPPPTGRRATRSSYHRRTEERRVGKGGV